MKYRKGKNGEDISILGYGCMRFSKRAGRVDMEKTEKEILLAIDKGVNYFDTAYIYPGSEAALGAILHKNDCRDKASIATKLPQYLINSTESIEKYFKEQLKRLKTDHIDYYLMHMLTDIASWEKLKKLGIEDWIDQKKREGKIKNIGFSFHGDTEMFISILDSYDWDFCQIQYNYMDEHSQAGRRGLEHAYDKGIPVIIMEPLRGGKLVNMLPQKAKNLFKKHPNGWGPAEWALRWLWDQPGVTCVLSGMNSGDMIEENCRIASEAGVGDLKSKDIAFIEIVKNVINEKMKVGCTECRYCMPCPKGVDIPGLFKCYNEMYTENKATGRHEYFQVIGLRKEAPFATQCIECGKCESHCPQHLPIRELIKQADREVRPFPYKIALGVARRFMKLS